ncbi:hypothetical protein A5791_14075 [Mycobacterium sp. 852002-51163_SCH5372311]|uniref:hypothetical protein n=1 Tax=Mycobacterium sp. 852002-51163_SCH5372311 TaxID=1834097 RepID=UPI0008014D6B|nr:hypothetical protein [Mycobacterium sp. 852002-51163_SCH5372311]OBF92118.1 hypothetical protein A5791_14075 [Mycobacterium sp. 852002-51163_SCH5372311]
MRTIRDLMVRVSPVAIRPPRRRGTINKSTLVLSTDASGRTLWVDIGWQACDERLVTIAEANALRIGACRRFDRLALIRSKR